MRLLCRCVLSTALAAAAPLLAQPDFDKVEVKSQKLAEGVYMLTGSGGNMGVSAGPDGVFLIDDQYAPLTAKIRAAIAAISDKPLRFVLNTHWHGDHTGGNKNLGEAGVLIVAHDNVLKRMSADQFIAAFNSKVPASPTAALPVVTFTDGVTFHLNGEELVATHVPPAHTDGDALVQFKKANVLHMGDTFFNGIYPFIDLSSGGSVDGAIAAADRGLVLADANTKIIPGHGSVGGRAELKAFRDMLAGCRDAVAPLVNAGKTLDEVKAAKPTKAFDEKWGNGFMKPEPWVGILYADLSQKKGASK